MGLPATAYEFRGCCMGRTHLKINLARKHRELQDAKQLGGYCNISGTISLTYTLASYIREEVRGLGAQT